MLVFNFVPGLQRRPDPLKAMLSYGVARTFYGGNKSQLFLSAVEYAKSSEAQQLAKELHLLQER
jgi:hypothetical protein